MWGVRRLTVLFNRPRTLIDHAQYVVHIVKITSGHQAYENRIYATYVWRHGEP